MHNSKIIAENILKKERRSLAKAITLTESILSTDQILAQEIIESILPNTGKSLRIGISGVPGVGKSTFIENFGMLLIEKGHKVAVLAIDPSSPISGGSILGDKTRMNELSNNENAFIRPTPSSGHLGGVAKKTKEAILLCEAFGFDIIIVETVGVGQSEFEVSEMVDFFLLLMLPNAGDELQGIKKGILELANAIIINKADGEQIAKAKLSEAQLCNSLEFLKSNSFWKPKIQTCSALLKTNLENIYQMILEFKNSAELNHSLFNNRLKQNEKWFQRLVTEMLIQKLDSNPQLKNYKTTLQIKVLNGELLAEKAAGDYLKKIKISF